MINKDSTHCTYCTERIESWQSFRLHLVWFTRIHNVCYHDRLTELELALSAPGTTADYRNLCAQNAFRLPLLYSAPIVKAINAHLVPVTS